MIEKPTPTVGETIPQLQMRPTTVQLFRFSVATNNVHRIHYDQAYAREEGYPDVLVQSHLHGCLLSQAILAWAPDHAVLRRLQWQNRNFAVPGDELTVSGVVADTSVDDQGVRHIRLEIEERNQDDELCVRGSAEIHLPAESPR